MQGEILELGQSLFEVFGSKEGYVVSNLGFGWERKGGDVGGIFSFVCFTLALYVRGSSCSRNFIS